MKINQKVRWLRILIHASAWVLFLVLVWRYFSGNLTYNPIQAATQATGKYALIFLVLSLSCTPLTTITSSRIFIPVRRTLGLYAFAFAAVHFSLFVGVDYGFNWGLIAETILNKRYTLVGSLVFIILLLLAVTSSKWSMKLLGKNWSRLHQLIYIAAPLAVLHYAWARKGDIFRLQGDVIQPLFFGVLVAVLLFLRIPAIKSGIHNLRK